MTEPLSGFGVWRDTEIDVAVSTVKDELDEDFEHSASGLF